MKIDLSGRTGAIQQYIGTNRQKMQNDLRAVVQINSPSEFAQGIDAVGEYLLPLLQDLDVSVKKISAGEFGQHLLIESRQKSPPNLLFCGHMDTVFPVGTEWPFRVENGRAFGPGVIDMKSGLISLIYALKAIHSSGGIPFGYKILFNSDEDQGSPESKKIIPELVKEIDFAFILEPAEPDGRLIVRRKGIGKFVVHVAGRAAHAGKSPETGLNAILELAHQIIAAEKLARKKTGTTMNTGVVNGGQSAFIVAEEAQAVIESRVWSLEEQRRVEEGMQALPSRVHVQGTRTAVSGGFHRPPLLELPGAALLICAAKAAAHDLGIKLNFGGSGAASDGNNITSFGIPVLDGMGPVGGREHSHDEYIELPSLFERSELLACTALHLCNLFHE
jgi:glutamate carboxypeptidase